MMSSNIPPPPPGYTINSRIPPPPSGYTLQGQPSASQSMMMMMLDRTWDAIKSGYAAHQQGIRQGLGDILYGGAQIGARMAEASPEIGATEPARPGAAQEIDRATQQREQQYQQTPAVRQHPFLAGAGRGVGDVAANAPLAMIPGGQATLPGRVAAGALTGAAGAAMQPVTSGQFGPQKALQMVEGAAAGGILGPLWDKIAGRGAMTPQRLAEMQRTDTFRGADVPLANKPSQIEPVEQRVGQRVAETAQGLGEPRTAYEGGGVIRNALNRFFADRSQAAEDFGAFDRLMHGSADVRLPNTVSQLKKLMGRFPNAPELTGLLTSPKLKSLANVLEERTETIPGKASRVLDEHGQPMWTQRAQQVQRGGSLSVPETRELRTQIGYLLENPQAGPEAIPQAQVRQLYGALSRDLETAARQRGPAALKALLHANQNYGMRINQMDRLRPLLKQDAPETSLNRLGLAGQEGGDAQLLQQARKVLTPQEWGDTAATILSHMGRKTSQKGNADARFSFKAFNKNWYKLSGEAKDQLFGPNVPGTPRANLERLARVTEYMREVARHDPSNPTAHWFQHSMATAIHSVTGIPHAISRFFMGPGLNQFLNRAPGITTHVPPDMVPEALDQLVKQSVVAGTGVMGARAVQPAMSYAIR